MYSKELTKLLNDVQFYEKYKMNLGTDPKVKSEGDVYSQFELYSAFELISNKEHWKDPINTIIKEIDYEICNQASIHFTGGYLEREANKNSDEITVTSDGYFVNIGS